MDFFDNYFITVHDPDYMFSYDLTIGYIIL